MAPAATVLTKYDSYIYSVPAFKGGNLNSVMAIYNHDTQSVHDVSSLWRFPILNADL